MLNSVLDKREKKEIIHYETVAYYFFDEERAKSVSQNNQLTVTIKP